MLVMLLIFSGGSLGRVGSGSACECSKDNDAQQQAAAVQISPLGADSSAAQLKTAASDSVNDPATPKMQRSTTHLASPDLSALPSSELKGTILGVRLMASGVWLICVAASHVYISISHIWQSSCLNFYAWLICHCRLLSCCLCYPL